MDLNVAVLAGRLAADPELRTFESGSCRLRLLLTVRTMSPHPRVDVIPVTLWEPDDDLRDELPVRGDRVFVAGALQRRFWETAEGRRSRIEIVAHQIQIDGDDLDSSGSFEPIRNLPETLPTGAC